MNKKDMESEYYILYIVDEGARSARL